VAEEEAAASETSEGKSEEHLAALREEGERRTEEE